MLWGENRGKWIKSAIASSPTQDTSGLSHRRWATTGGQPPALTILYMHCTDRTECFSHTPGTHSVCGIRTPLGVDRKILSIRKEAMLSGTICVVYRGLWGLVVGPAVVAQWQSTGGSRQRCPGFKSQWVLAFSLSLYFCLITSKFIYFQHEARCSEKALC